MVVEARTSTPTHLPRRTSQEINRLVEFVEGCPRAERPTRLQQLDPTSISTLLRRVALCTVSETANQFHDCPSFRAPIFRYSLQEGGVPMIGARVTRTSSAHVLATVDQPYAWQVLLGDRRLNPFLIIPLEQARLELDQINRYRRKDRWQILEDMRQESAQRIADNEAWFRDLREGYYQSLRQLNEVADGHVNGFVAGTAEVVTAHRSEKPSIDPLVVTKAQKGDPQAFEEIYQSYFSAIYNYVYRMMGDSEDSVDLTQDTFLKAHQGMSKTRPGLRVRPWLYRIARNLCIDEVRHRKLLKMELLDDSPTERTSYEGVPRRVYHPAIQAAILDTSPDSQPELYALADENREEVRSLLDRLHPRYRLCLVLREYHDLSYDEIAEVLTTTRAAVKSLLFRAREEFRLAYGRSERQPALLNRI